MKVEGAWIDGDVFSLVLVQSASVCRIRQEERGEWETDCKGQMITSRTLLLSTRSERREDRTVRSYFAEI